MTPAVAALRESPWPSRGIFTFLTPSPFIQKSLSPLRSLPTKIAVGPDMSTSQYMVSECGVAAMTWILFLIK